MAKDQGEELVCSMIMRSENAALRNSNNNKNDSLSKLQAARVSRYCSLLFFVICNINTISVSVTVLQTGNILYLAIIKLIIMLTLYCNKNFNP